MNHRVLFFGSADFSIPLLEALFHDPRFNIVGVITQPDRPVGRKKELAPPPVKDAAKKLGLPVFQYENVKEASVINELRELKPDIITTASFGQIMPQALLDIASHGAINFHWSLLPKYRGASPIQASILNGDEKTGATIILMDSKMDHGDMLASFEEPISNNDTSDKLYHRISEKGAKLFTNTIADYIEGKLKPQPQDHNSATFVTRLERDHGRLDPSTKSALKLERAVRAYQPWPGTYLDLENKRLKVFEARLGSPSNHPPLTRFTQEELPAISCAKNSTLLLVTVQPEGKQPMDGSTFLRGKRDWNTI